MNELAEIRNKAYESATLFNVNTKAWHDKQFKLKEFVPGDKVLLYNSKLKLFPGKLRSRWTSLYEIVEVFSHGTVKIKNLHEWSTFKVNGQKLKVYHGGTFNAHEEVGRFTNVPNVG